MTGNDVRQKFLEYFKGHDHRVVRSSSPQTCIAGRPRCTAACPSPRGEVRPNSFD